MKKDKFQSDLELQDVERIRLLLSKKLGQKVTITLNEIFLPAVDGEEPKSLGYGYAIEVAEAIYGRDLLASHLSWQGLTTFWDAFSFGVFYGRVNPIIFDENIIPKAFANSSKEMPF